MPLQLAVEFGQVGLARVADGVFGAQQQVAGQHGGLDVLAAAGALAVQQAEAQRGRDAEGAGDVGRGLVRADHPLGVLVPGVLIQRHIGGGRLVPAAQLPQGPAAERAHHRVERGAAGARPGRPVRAGVQVHDAGVQFPGRLVVDAETGRGVAAHVVHDRVGLAHQPPHGRPAFLALQVDGQAFLALEGARPPAEEQPGVIAGRGLDLDDARAHVGQQRRAERAGQPGGEVQYEHPGQRP